MIGQCKKCTKLDLCLQDNTQVNCLSFEGLEECTTDKQRVERAKGDIEAIITKLNNECDMIVAAVSVEIHKTHDTNGRVTKMIAPVVQIYLQS
jgi:hypothetical protein